MGWLGFGVITLRGTGVSRLLRGVAASVAVVVVHLAARRVPRSLVVVVVVVPSAAGVVASTPAPEARWAASAASAV